MLRKYSSYKKLLFILINSSTNSFSTMDDVWKKKKTYFIGKYKLILSLKHKTRQKEGCLSGLLLGFVEDILLSAVKIYSLCLYIYIYRTVKEDSEQNEKERIGKIYDKDFR